MKNDPSILGKDGDLRPGLYRLMEMDKYAQSFFFCEAEEAILFVSEGWALLLQRRQLVREFNTAFASAHLLVRPLGPTEMRTAVLASAVEYL